MVGDFIELGGHGPEFDPSNDIGMTKYIVKSRTFSALKSFNHSYCDRQCTIELEEV